MITNKEFAKKAVNIAKNFRTTYVWGSFGHVMNDANINRLIAQYPENNTYLSAMHNADFAMDCCGLVKAVVWGFSGDHTQTYGGAQYCSNGLSDMNVEMLHTACSGVSTNFSNIEVGELVFTSDLGHVGIYAGSGLVVESTPSWKSGVQITNCANIASHAGLNSRTWHSHGKLTQCIKYETKIHPVSTLPIGQSNNAIPAQYFDRNVARAYNVAPEEGVNLRKGPGIQYAVIKTIPCGQMVYNYGYYSKDSNGVVWLYVKLVSGDVGYMCRTYLD